MKKIMSARGGSVWDGKKITKIIFSSLILTMVFGAVLSLSTANVSANVINEGLANFKSGATDLPGGTDTDLGQTIGSVIQFLLGFLGILAVILFLYAGFLWMTAGGDDAKTKKAKDYIKNAVIGMVIIMAAYIITNFVLVQIGDTLGN